jgi:hypothetical protein
MGLLVERMLLETHDSGDFVTAVETRGQRRETRLADHGVHDIKECLARAKMMPLAFK